MFLKKCAKIFSDKKVDSLKKKMQFCIQLSSKHCHNNLVRVTINNVLDSLFL